MFAVVLLLVPLQAAAEEYVFRGFLMQTLGGWLRHPAFAILLPVPLFVFGHDYQLLGMVDIAVFAIVAGWLTWRTGGLEAALALHVVNNVAIFALSAVGAADANVDDVSPVQLLLYLAMSAVSVLLILRLARTKRIQRIRQAAPVRPIADLGYGAPRPGATGDAPSSNGYKRSMAVNRGHRAGPRTDPCCLEGRIGWSQFAS